MFDKNEAQREAAADLLARLAAIDTGIEVMRESGNAGGYLLVQWPVVANAMRIFLAAARDSAAPPAAKALGPNAVQVLAALSPTGAAVPYQSPAEESQAAAASLEVHTTAEGAERLRQLSAAGLLPTVSGHAVLAVKPAPQGRTLARAQFCGNCGKALGSFAHHSRHDGPLSCGATACERAAGDAEREQVEAAQERAAADGFGRYT